MNLRLLLSILLFAALSADGQQPTKKQLQNLESFARLYGYVRYFHPADEAAEVDWDKFLYYGCKTIENAKDKQDLQHKLGELFGPIAPSVQITTNQSKAFDKTIITPTNASKMKLISWQHIGMGNDQGLYKSARTNRYRTVAEPNAADFGTASTFLDARPYRGMKFRLTGWMRTEVSSGQGQMWLRIDQEDKPRGFFDNMNDRPVKSNTWQAYEISGVVDDHAKNFALGAFLMGKGKLWIDNFKLEVEHDGVWKTVPFDNWSFEQETTKGWYTKAPGYNFSLVKEKASEGNQALLISDVSKSAFVTELFKQQAAFGDYVTKPIGNGLFCHVPLALYGTDSATYPSADRTRLTDLQQKIEASIVVSQTPEDLYTRLSAIAMTWNVFQHFFPYKEEANLEWDKELPEALAAAYAANTRASFGKVLRVMTEKLKDGHVSVSFMDANYFTIPVVPVLAEGKVVISNVGPEIESDTSGLQVGDVILSIDGTPAIRQLEMLKKEISGSPQWKTHNALNQLLNGAKDTEVVLQVSRNGDTKNLRLMRKGYDRPRDTSKIRAIGDGLIYINIGNTDMKEITEILPKLQQAKGIVCDLRGYPKNNHGLIAHLMTVQDSDKWMFVPQIYRPDFEDVSYDALGWAVSPAKPHLAAKVVFLTGGGAVSYAESYMGFIKHYKLATIVGQPTAGANGNINPFKVPGGYRIVFTGMKVKQHDGSQLHAIGIQPDVFVEQTLKGVAAGRDEFLEKAIALLNGST